MARIEREQSGQGGSSRESTDKPVAPGTERPAPGGPIKPSGDIDNPGKGEPPPPPPPSTNP